MSHRRILFSIVLAAIVSACATVTSEQATDTKQPPGLVYYLPMRMLKVTVTPATANYETLAKSRGDAQAALETARKAVDLATTAAANTKKMLDAADKNQRPTLEMLNDRALSDLQDARIELDGTTRVLRRENARLDRARRTGCDFTAKVEALAAQADTKQRFAARLSHNMTRDDSLKLEVSAEGLLTTSNATATDRTGDILAQLGGLASTLNPSAIGDNRQSPLGEMNCSDARVLVFDPADGWQGDDNNGMLPAFARLNLELSRYGIEIENGFHPAIPRIVPSPRWGAIYYRSPMPMVVTIRQDSQVMNSVVVDVPQMGPVAYLPMKANAFVKTEDKVTLVDGSVTSWDTTRPSEALEVVQLPISILKSALSVPTDIFRLRVDYDSQAKSAGASDIERMKQAETLRQIKECVAKADADNVSSADCFKE